MHHREQPPPNFTHQLDHGDLTDTGQLPPVTQSVDHSSTYLYGFEPDEISRVVVARIELTSPGVEQAIADAIEWAYHEEATVAEAFGESVSEPRLRRGCELVAEPDISQWCLSRADELAAEPADDVTW